jgi:hypothetical protein
MMVRGLNEVFLSFKYVHKSLLIKYFVVAVCRLFAQVQLVSNKSTEHTQTLHVCS